jgi:hypothetical protein
MDQGYLQYEDPDDPSQDYGYVYPTDALEEEVYRADDARTLQAEGPAGSYRYDYDDESADGDIQINDQYWDEEAEEEIWEEEYPESWIPYPAASLSDQPAAIPAAAGSQNSQHIIIGVAAPGLYPDPMEVSAHWCEVYPELCAARPAGRGVAVRNNSKLNYGLGLGASATVDAKGLPILRYVDFSGLGVALVLIVVVLLALNLGWDSEVSVSLGSSITISADGAGVGGCI